MQVKCHSKSGRSIPEKARVMGESDDTDFSPLSLGEEYEVYGLMFYKARVDLLVCPSSNGPMWVPSCLFDIINDEIPRNWGCVITEKSRDYSVLYEAFGIQSICGYLELVRSYKHYIGIIERDSDELKIFYSRK